MSNKEDIMNEETVNEVEETVETAENETANEANEQEQPVEMTPEERIASLEAQLEKEKKEYVFLMAEFDNFRKRTLKDKAEIIKNGGYLHRYPPFLCT